MHNVIGTCGCCGGAVAIPLAYYSINPPLPKCLKCGRTPKQAYGPLLEMEEEPRGKEFKHIPFDNSQYIAEASAKPTLNDLEREIRTFQARKGKLSGSQGVGEASSAEYEEKRIKEEEDLFLGDGEYTRDGHPE